MSVVRGMEHRVRNRGRGTAFSEPQSLRTSEPQRSEVGGQTTWSKVTSDIGLLTSGIDDFNDFPFIASPTRAKRPELVKGLPFNVYALMIRTTSRVQRLDELTV